MTVAAEAREQQRERGRAGMEPSPQVRAALFMKVLRRKHSLSRAVRAMLSSELCTVNAAMVQKLKDKHPDLRDPVAFKAQLMSNNRVTSNTTLTPSDVANALRGMDRTTASGFGGQGTGKKNLVF